MENRSLTCNTLDAPHVASVADAMQQSHAVRLQPYNIQTFFLDAFQHIGGQIHERERGRWEITHVPAAIRRHSRRNTDIPDIAQHYSRVCFDKDRIAGPIPADLLCPGHTLFDAAVDEVLARYHDLMQRGTLLVEPAADHHDDPIRVILPLEHVVQNGSSQTISKRIHFVQINQNHSCTDMGPSPHLDLRPLQNWERPLIQSELESHWLRTDFAALVLAHAQEHIVPNHLHDVRSQHLPVIAKAEQAVRYRLTQEINYWDYQAEQAKEQERAGRQPRVSSVQARKRADNLHERRQQRQAAFESARNILELPPQIVGCALVIPQGLLEARSVQTANHNEDMQSRIVVERLAMQAVMQAEQELGYQPDDVSTQKLGYDVRSCCEETNSYRFIEVKGRAFDATDITVTANEIRTALNTPDQFILAVVRVKDGDPERPQYVRQPFLSQPDPALKSSRFSLKELLKGATQPC